MKCFSNISPSSLHPVPAVLVHQRPNFSQAFFPLLNGSGSDLVPVINIATPGARVDLISHPQLSRSGHSSSSKPSPRFLTWLWTVSVDENVMKDIIGGGAPKQFCHRHQGLGWEPIFRQAGSRGSGGTCWKRYIFIWLSFAMYMQKNNNFNCVKKFIR